MKNRIFNVFLFKELEIAMKLVQKRVKFRTDPMFYRSLHVLKRADGPPSVLLFFPSAYHKTHITTSVGHLSANCSS